MGMINEITNKLIGIKGRMAFEHKDYIIYIDNSRKKKSIVAIFRSSRIVNKYMTFLLHILLRNVNLKVFTIIQKINLLIILILKNYMRLL